MVKRFIGLDLSQISLIAICDYTVNLITFAFGKHIWFAILVILRV